MDLGKAFFVMSYALNLQSQIVACCWYEIDDRRNGLVIASLCFNRELLYVHAIKTNYK